MFSQKATGLDELLHRPRPSPWERFWRSPTLFLGQLLYAYSRSRPAVSNIHEKPVTVVCVSDTHNSQPELPDGDVLVHAGDLTQSGTFVELQSAIDWLRRQPHRHKVVIAGNHDILLDPASNHRLQRDGHRETREDLDWGDVTYLQDTATTLTCANGRRLRVYGSPWSPRHGSWAFQYPRVKNIWSHAVPDNIDILITHSPPRGHLDLAGLGCVHLLGELWRLRPRLHVFGHVHEGYGKEGLVFDGLQAAFERLIICGGGIASLLGVVKEAISSRLAGDGVVQTILVNAAVVGGLRDKMKPIISRLWRMDAWLTLEQKRHIQSCYSQLTTPNKPVTISGDPTVVLRRELTWLRLGHERRQGSYGDPWDTRKSAWEIRSPV